MPSRQIKDFAKILVRDVRDAAIRDGDIARHPESPSSIARRWRKLGSGECDSLLEAVIPDCVDMALFFLLKAIDDEGLKLQFVTESGDVVDLNREGLSELAGWYLMSSEGWVANYSKERLSGFTEMTNDGGEPQGQ